MPEFRFPNHTQRVTIVGRTGTGKSMMGAWLLSNASFDKRPWVIIDYKYERLFRDPRVKHLITELEPTSRAPRKKGLYIVHPRPDEVEEMEDFMWRIWERGNTGVVVDEGYMLPDKAAFQALLTQGRSKHIPMIVLSQRPVEMNRFAFSEADFYSVFRLNDLRDWKTIEAFAPINPHEVLPRFNSWWYDVANEARFRLMPVPDADSILARIADRAPRPFWG